MFAPCDHHDSVSKPANAQSLAPSRATQPQRNQRYYRNQYQRDLNRMQAVVRQSQGHYEARMPVPVLSPPSKPTGSIVPLPAEALSQYSPEGAPRDLVGIRAPSCFVGSRPLYPDPPVASHQDDCQNRTSPEPSSRQRLQSLTSQPTSTPHRRSYISHPPPVDLSHSHQDKDLPSPPPIPEVEPPSQVSWGCANRPQYCQARTS
ncbi:hypothetical protein BU25DRAFT_419851 [Macroventuria anomochaeta]|uniref:Uncharacterized protein n=1 Tax=Macroventuria anomochaeta TaxID=301207 RepID=A0ACB6S5K4_9PLEO|nr:uncharacterized protein BU25DRAFT_419851 [Macroventuria anomochaeta]KAF2629541.1 hypothetical protein BU25DRAFT_419851 [Macroventuria anomochaeta]